jgi:hypothetical protein
VWSAIKRVVLLMILEPLYVLFILVRLLLSKRKPELNFNYFYCVALSVLNFKLGTVKIIPHIYANWL